MSSGDDIDQLLGELRAVSLPEVDERAELLRRTDTKYVLEPDEFLALVGELADDHEALEIDGRRRFAYQSVYFDSAELRCFWDHVRGCAPRFKARTRLYRDTGRCSFEVKLKLEDGETDKRQVEHPPEAAGELNPEAERCLMDALGQAGVEPPRAPLRPSLRTCFDRITLVPRKGRERTTCDLRLRLVHPGGARARLRDGLVVVETKTEHGDGPTDQLLERLGVKPVSFSKYRTGIALLVDAAHDVEYEDQVGHLLTVDAGPARGS